MPMTLYIRFAYETKAKMTYVSKIKQESYT